MSSIAERMTSRRETLRMPGQTLRLRLTLLYGSLFLASGSALLAITYVLVSRQYTGNFFVATQTNGSVGVAGLVPNDSQAFDSQTAPSVAPDPQQLLSQAHQRASSALHQLLIQYGAALAIITLISICLGWLIAGRALRPLRTITAAAREISASSLHRRLALDGPDDELRQLGTTFNGLLERLEASFAAQRQFVANASHELRTPLTLERTLVEVALADPDATVDSLRQTCRRVIGAGEQQERLIEALLTLSRSQRGLDHREPFDLAAVARDVLLARRAEARRHDLRIANLVDNAIRHNVPGGRIAVETATTARGATLSVGNSGPEVPPAEIDRLLQPFERLADGHRGGQGEQQGLGLGLSIAQAIATAHAASLAVRSRAGGGLDIEAVFPPSDRPGLPSTAC